MINANLKFSVEIGFAATCIYFNSIDIKNLHLSIFCSSLQQIILYAIKQLEIETDQR